MTLMTTTETLLSSFDRIARNRMVLISDVRSASGLDRASFDAALTELRVARVLTCDASDGRHTRLPEAARLGGIEEDGQTLVYVARRGD